MVSPNVHKIDLEEKQSQVQGISPCSQKSWTILIRKKTRKRAGRKRWGKAYIKLNIDNSPFNRQFSYFLVYSFYFQS